MADLVSQELRTKMLAAYFAGGETPTQLFIRLFKDEASINEATVLADISAHEQSGSGYSVLTVNPADWTVESGTGGIQARLDDQTWTTTADDWGTLRWAVIATTADDTGDILLARDYGTGKTVTGVGANVTIDDLFFKMND